MPIDKLSKLTQMMEFINTIAVTPQEIEKFLAMVVSAVKQNNDSFKKLSAENLQEIKNTLAYLKVEHAEVLKEIDAKNKKQKGDFEDKLQQVNYLIDQIKMIEVKDGKDGKDGKDADPKEVVQLVLKEIPPVVLDTGEIIVNKINDLEIDPEKQIDASHIKNLPKTVEKSIIAHSRNLDFFDETTLVISNPTQIKFAGAGVQVTQEAGTGALLVTIAGGAGATEEYETMTDSGDHTNYTISATPNAGTLLVINSNTGQIVEPGRYTNTGTAVVFTSSQEVDGETPVFMARFAH